MGITSIFSQLPKVLEMLPKVIDAVAKAAKAVQDPKASQDSKHTLESAAIQGPATAAAVPAGVPGPAPTAVPGAEQGPIPGRNTWAAAVPAAPFPLGAVAGPMAVRNPRPAAEPAAIQQGPGAVADPAAAQFAAGASVPKDPAPGVDTADIEGSWPEGRARLTHRDPMSSFIEAMRSKPRDTVVQITGCGALQGFTDQPGEVAERAWSAMAESILGNLDSKDIGMWCALPFGRVAGDEAMTDSLHKTRAVEALIKAVQAHPEDEDVQARLLPVIGASSGTSVNAAKEVEKWLGFEALFGALDRFQGHPEVMMSAWRGLAPLAANPLGAAHIACFKGPLHGIVFMVEQMRKFPAPHLVENPVERIGLRSQIMRTFDGLLSQDESNVYGSTALRAGILNEVLSSMKVEWDIRATQDTGCMTINRLLKRNEDVAGSLMAGDGEEAIIRAIETFQGDDRTRLGNGQTMGKAFPVLPKCAAVLERLAAASSDLSQRLLDEQFPEKLLNMREDMRQYTQPLLNSLEVFRVKGKKP